MMPNRLQPAWLWLAAAAALCLTLVSCGTATQTEKPAKVLSADDRATILAALQEKSLPFPVSLELNESGYLVATFELADPVSAEYLRAFATESLLAIRNRMQARSLTDKYRVTLNGPSPGPDLVLRYGSARFIEGGSVEWDPMVKP
ncbi:MAG: hypothetical protein FJ279_24330 [Planctomycetes bacterium]|nr:hypothetical protein [Planctomycetota bacterium]